MNENHKIFDDLQRDWEAIKGKPSFDAQEVKAFQERVIGSRRRASVDGKRVAELFDKYQELGKESLQFLIANGFDDFEYLLEYMRWFGKPADPDRVKIITYILDSNPDIELLRKMFYSAACETEELALRAYDQMINLDIEDYELRWVLEQHGYTGTGYAGRRRPSSEYKNALLSRVANELLSRGPTRRDLLNMLRYIPELETTAWNRLQEVGFLMGTLTTLVREFPEEYAKFAWEKILEHDANSQRMEKVIRDFNFNSPVPKYVQLASDWLAENQSGD